MGIDVKGLLQQQLAAAHQSLEATMIDVTQELAEWLPGGKANPIGTTYAHVVYAEDVVTHMLVKGEPPLASTSFSDRIGFSPAMPFPGVTHGDIGDWYHNAKVNIAEVRDYAKSVQADADQIIAGLTDEELNRELDLSSSGLPNADVAWVIAVFVIGHINNIMGEISAIKGLKGLKGYPF